jgi:hypothetical protein
MVVRCGWNPPRAEHQQSQQPARPPTQRGPALQLQVSQPRASCCQRLDAGRAVARRAERGQQRPLLQRRGQGLQLRSAVRHALRLDLDARQPREGGDRGQLQIVAHDHGGDGGVDGGTQRAARGAEALLVLAAQEARDEREHLLRQRLEWAHGSAVRRWLRQVGASRRAAPRAEGGAMVARARAMGSDAGGAVELRRGGSTEFAGASMRPQSGEPRWQAPRPPAPTLPAPPPCRPVEWQASIPSPAAASTLPSLTPATPPPPPRR